ncbi:MAG: HAD family phosphatase [Acidobacteria bacterium]|nr:HAD family phosphatase [Acidobacteriota bacterium]
MKLKAVLCDIDGTLIDSNVQHAESWQRTFAHFGVPATFEEVLRQIGKGSDHLLPVFVPNKHEREALEPKLKDFRKKLFHREYIDTIQPFPKSRELLQRMITEGLRVAVASSTDKDDLPKLKQIARIDDLVEKETTAGDAAHSKPDPDIFQSAIGKLGLRRGEVIALGDTPWDIEAAGRAGVDTIAVTCGGWSRDDLASAVAVYDDPAHLLREFDHSPLARRS